MRWPFGPPHLTLKPSKKTQKTKRKKENREIKRKKRKSKKIKNTKIPKKSFSVISLIFCGCPKFPFLDNLAKKRTPKKHYKNRGFSNPFFWKQFCVMKRPFLEKKKKTNPEIPVIIFWGLCLLFQKQKNLN